MTAIFSILLCLTSGLIIASTAVKRQHYDLEMADQLFEDFIKSYDKNYPHHLEKQKRLEIFKENLKVINGKNSVGGAVFAINQFSDLTKEESREYYMGFKPASSIFGAEDECEVVTDNDITTKDAPDTLNWITKGAVTPVKSQLACGSCWAFSTIGNIEGQYFIKTKQLKRFSEQELVDCSKSNDGCSGGLMTGALTDLKDLGGVELESSYPYAAKDNSCQFNSSLVVAKLAGCTNYQLVDEVKLKEVLAKNGPISIGLNGDGVIGYTQGILEKAQCDEFPLTHAVLLVGYGTENGVDYWLIKNSWGTTWGEEGYLRMSRGENTCGLMNPTSASAVLQ